MSGTQRPPHREQRFGTILLTMARAILSGEDAPDFPTKMSNGAGRAQITAEPDPGRETDEDAEGAMAGTGAPGVETGEVVAGSGAPAAQASQPITVARQSARTSTPRRARLSLAVILSSFTLLIIIVVSLIVLIRVFSPSRSTANLAPLTPATTVPGSTVTRSSSVPSLVLGPSTPLTITSVLGGTGTSSLLASPEETVVARNGNIYVADSLNHRVAVFNRPGKLVQSITNGPSGPLSAPFAISLLPNGDPLVLDSELGVLIEYNLQGKLVRSSSPALGLVHSRGLAVSPTGQILVANTPANEIDVLDSAFTITHREVGQPAGQPLDFAQPSAVAYGPDGSIYVLDCQNNRIIHYTSDWQKLRILPVATTDTVHSPRILALPDGRVLTTDPRDSMLLVFTPGATQPRSYTLGAARVPLGIAPGGPATLLITCSGSNQVLIAKMPAM